MVLFHFAECTWEQNDGIKAGRFLMNFVFLVNFNIQRTTAAPLHLNIAELLLDYPGREIYSYFPKQSFSFLFFF